MSRGVSFTPSDASGLPTATLRLGARTVVLRSPQLFPRRRQVEVAIALGPAGGSAELYVEGERTASAAIAGPLSELRDVDNWFGRSHVTDDPAFSRSVSELRVYSRALSPKELETSWAAGPDPLFLE